MRLVLLFAIAGCHSALPGGGTLTGRVVVGDEQDLGGITVRAEGPQSSSTTTDSQGRYQFDLGFGAYSVSAEVRSTVEATRAIELELDRAREAPDLIFTPAGGLSGRATRGGRAQGNAGILVTVDGTAAIGVSDDGGAYQIERVPVGSYSVRAQAQGFRPASVDAQVVRWGEVTEVPELDLVIAPGHAALRGTTLLFGKSDHSGTRVEVVGTGLETLTAADGGWAIDAVPEGTWSLHFVNGSFEETVSQVEALVGSDGLVIDGSLYPLPTSPLTLFDARRLATVPSTDRFTVSPDGSRLVFNGLNNQKYALQSLGLDGTEVALSDVSADSFVFGPDGQRVVFGSGSQLFTVAAAGGTPSLLMRGPRGASFSPDGGMLAYEEPDPMTGERSLGVISAGGGTPKELLSDPDLFSFTWNHDGTRILEYTNVDPSGNLGWVKVIATDGTLLTTVSSPSGPPLVSADQRSALVISAGSLVMVDLEAGTSATLASGVISIVGYAGDRVVYKSSDTLFSVPLTGGSPATLGMPGDHGWAVLSANGSSVAYTSDCASQACKLWKVATAGGTPEMLTDHAAVMALSPDGRAVLYSSDVDPKGAATLWVGGDGKPPRQLDSGVYYVTLRFSEDGSHALYFKDVTQVNSTQYGTLFIAPTAGGTPVKLAENAKLDFTVAPDGKHLALDTQPPNANETLLLAPVDGSAAVPILDGLSQSAWSAKSALVVLRTGGVAPYRFQDGFYLATP
jgi:Tol biopolymer transport system component